MPTDIQEVLNRSLATHRSQRYETARQLHDDLAALATADDIADARRTLALRASLIAQASENGFGTDPAYSGTGSHIFYGTREAFIEDDDGDNLSVWVAIVTATVVASALLWLMLLR